MGIETPFIQLPLVVQNLEMTCGSACFESLYQYYFEKSPGQNHFSRQLRTYELGFTPIENIKELALGYGLQAELKVEAGLSEVSKAVNNHHVVFVTWWYEDAGHYSLVMQLTENYIVLMDPWLERETPIHRMPLGKFIPLWKTRGAKLLEVYKP